MRKNVEAMHLHNKERIDKMVDNVILAIDKSVNRKEKISVTRLAYLTGYSRSFFYQNIQVRTAVDNAKKKTSESKKIPP